MKSLHVIGDLAAADRVVDTFGGSGPANRYVVLVERLPAKVGEVRRLSDVRPVVVGSKEYERLLHEENDVIWIHGVTTFNVRFVLACEDRFFLFWCAEESDYRDYVGRWERGAVDTLRWLRTSSVRAVARRLALYLAAKTRLAARLPSEHGLFFRRVDGYCVIRNRDEPVVGRLLPNAELFRMSSDVSTASDVRVGTIGLGDLMRKLKKRMKRCGKRGKSNRPPLDSVGRIVFHSNGGKGRMPDLVFGYTDAMSLPVNGFQRPGWVFLGWSWVRDGDVVRRDGDAVGQIPQQGGTIVLYAQWRGPSCRVRFLPNGGSGRMAEFSFQYGKPTPLPINGFSRAGYEFCGWSYVSTGPVYWKDGARIANPPMANGMATLYAQWRGRQCRIVFDANGGEGEMPAGRFQYGSPTALPRNSFVRKDYEFLGWAYAPEGRICWRDGAMIKHPPLQNGVAKLYARWKGFPCVVKFDPCGGIGQMHQFDFSYGNAVRLPANAFSRPLHAFLGWSSSPAGEVFWKNRGFIKSPPYRDGVVWLYARWSGLPCRIVFDANGGDGIMEDFSFAYDARTALPMNKFTHRERLFAGWAVTPGGPVIVRNGGCVGDIAMRTMTVTLFARWRRNASGGSPGSYVKRGSFGRPLRVLHIIGGRLMVDGVIQTFAEFSETEDKFVLVTSESVFPVDGIRERSKLEIVLRDSARHHELQADDSYDVVWAHGAGQDQIRYCNGCDPRTVVVWSSWGFDYVDYVGRWWYGTKTTLMWLRAMPLRTVCKTMTLWLLAKLRLNKLSPSEHGRFFRRVDFFSCVLQEEEKFLRRVLNSDVRRICFSYLQNTKKRMSAPDLVDLNQRGVWVGNSATLSNNYWDVFPRIARSKGYKVISSLVYGPDGIRRGPFAEEIEKCGRRYFGDDFMSISTFLSLHEYTRLMDSCSVFVFGQLRQQAVGNIFLALKRGGCVILHRDSPVYAFCLRKKFKVYTLEDLDRGIDSVIADYRKYQRETASEANKVASVRDALAKIRKSIRQIRGECERRQRDMP